jgi:hypothetical protein
MQKWIKAAQGFQQAKEAEAQKKALAQKAEVSAIMKNAAAQQEREAHVSHSVWQLDQFLKNDEGCAALALLKASGRHIVFGENRDGGGYGSVYFINGEGLQVSVEPMGMWVAYARGNVEKPRLSPMSPLDAVRAAVEYGGKDPAEIMVWLEGELNKIAEAAPAVS